ncbi:MAG: hypothetical protein ACOX83_07045 [Candidatus Spyradocola sp.]|jgi:hypothetical protein
MRKTHYHDYATEAFRLHARLGSAAAYRQRIVSEALARRAEGGGSAGPGSPTEAAVVRAEAALSEVEGTIRDLEAVERAMERIERLRGGTCILRAVREVYEAEADRELARGEIARRVDRLSVELPAGSATIYRWLGLARKIFAEERGLRTS